MSGNEILILFLHLLDTVSTTDLVVAFIEIMSANYPNFKGKILKIV